MGPENAVLVVLAFATTIALFGALVTATNVGRHLTGTIKTQCRRGAGFINGLDQKVEDWIFK